MKQLVKVLLVSALIWGWSISLAGAGMYASGSLIGVKLEDADISYSDPFYDDNDELSFDTGFGFAAAVGYAVDNGFRVEGEIAGRYNEMDKYSNDYGYVYIDDGYVSAFSLMANAFYNFMPESTISPFVGAGIGLVGISADFDYDDDDDGDWDDDSEFDTVPAYQLAAGVSIAVSEQMTVDVQYRYFKADDAEFDGFDMEYATQNAMVGLRYNF